MKPTLNYLDSAKEAWDATLNDDLDVLGKAGTPVPVPEFGSVGALPAAGSYDRCVAFVSDTTGWTLYMSNGSAWVPIAKRGSAVADFVGADLATLQSELNNFLQILRNAGVLAP